MRTDEFDYHLPPEQIAQQPAEPRDSARLLVVNRASRRVEHRIFRDIKDYVHPGDVLVLNDTRVIPARLHGRKLPSGGRIEILLLRRDGPQTWQALIAGKRMRQDSRFAVIGKDGEERATGEVVAIGDEGLRTIRFDQPIGSHLDDLGEMPLPPYIHDYHGDQERYQTVYARHEGAVAAPTAGLHFTPELLLELRGQGVRLTYITLHIGLDTFQPVNEEEISEHRIHSEWGRLSPETAEVINRAKLAGGHIFAAGTTAVRVLETAALRSAGVKDSLQHASEIDTELCPWRPVAAFEGWTDLYIYPGFRFRATDHLITNFHLPRSTLLMLISAFAGREVVLDVYRQAVTSGYRFYSFGDATLWL